MRPRILAPLAAVATLAFLAQDAPAQGVLATPTVDPTTADAPTFGDETLGASEIPGEIAVDLRDDATDADITDIDAKLGIVMHPSSGWSRAHDRLEVADVDVASEAGILDALSHDSRVEHAEPMALYRATFVPDDPLYESKQWH